MYSIPRRLLYQDHGGGKLSRVRQHRESGLPLMGCCRSDILQWLNSNAAAGKWYSAKHGQDAPPSSANVWDNVNPYDTWAGFLAMLDDDFVAALMTTTLTVAKNTVTDGGSYETFTAKMFLASTTEVGLANENGIAEGSKLALFSDNTSRLAYCTQAAIDKSNYGSDPTTSQAWYWWLRTPSSGNSYNVRYYHFHRRNKLLLR